MAMTDIGTPETPGFAAVPNWMIRDTSISPYAIAVYAALASHSGRGGIHPSHETLAAEARCSVRKVQDALDELRALGVIASLRRNGRGGRTSNSYTLHPNGAEVPAHGAVTSLSPTARDDGSNGTTCRQVTAPRAEEEEPVEEEPEKKSARTRATALPAKFVITAEMRQWAREEVPAVDVDARLGEWMDYWRGVGRPMKDWVATWRNGMRKQQEFAVRDGWKPAEQQGGLRDATAELLEEQKRAWLDARGLTEAEFEANRHDEEWLRAVALRVSA